MTDTSSLAVTTAEPHASIWLGLGQDTFRRNLANLKRVNECPGARLKHNRVLSAASGAEDKQYIFPFETERTLADDFALLASFKEEARTVSAATLQEDSDGDALTIRLAANSRLLPTVKSLFDTIIARLHECAEQRLSRERCQLYVLSDIVKVHRRRIHGKLRSKLWRPSKPNEKERPPLHQQIQNFLSQNRGQPAHFRTEALKLMKLYRSADECVAETQTEHCKLEEIVLKSRRFCLDMARVFETNNVDRIFDDHRLRSIKKLAHFVDISECMTDASRRYRQLFNNIRLEQLPAYKAVSLPTSPGSPPVNCYVHAEVQMITFFAQNPQLNRKLPRVVGASKAACYLCSRFVHNHGQFFISRTHGRIYHQWTVPDTFGVDELINQRRRYRRVLAAIYGEIRSTLQTSKIPSQRRQTIPNFPNESDVTLRRDIPRSLLPSEAGTLGTHQSPASSVAVQTPRQSMQLVPEAARTMLSLRETISSDDLSSRPGPGLDIDVAALSSHHRYSSPNSSSTGSFMPTSRPQPNSVVPPTSASRSHSPTPPASGPSIRPPPSLTTPGSPATIDFWDYPVSQTLTAGRFFRIKSLNMHLEVEMEAGGPFTGKVQLTDVPSVNSKMVINTIDIRTMAPGEQKIMWRSDSEENLVVNLQNGKKDGTMQMRLQWE